MREFRQGRSERDNLSFSIINYLVSVLGGKLCMKGHEVMVALGRNVLGVGGVHLEGI